MPTVPTTLEAWTYLAVTELIEAHCHEDERFDWKAQLPSEDRGRTRLVECVAAMANGEGGFIVFGVKDDRELTAPERIVGLNPADDFPKLFSDRIEKRMDPTPAYRVRAEGVPIANSQNVLRIVQVLKGLGPHSVGGRFLKRIPGGARAMSTAEVRSSIVNTEELQAKLRLLMLELISARNAAREIQKFADSGEFSPIRRVDTATIARLHAETLPLLVGIPRISENLSVVCGDAEALNYQLDCIAPLIGEAVGQSLSFKFAGEIVARGARSRSQVERVADIVVDLLARHFSEPAILKILAADAPGHQST